MTSSPAAEHERDPAGGDCLVVLMGDGLAVEVAAASRMVALRLFALVAFSLALSSLPLWTTPAPRP